MKLRLILLMTMALSATGCVRATPTSGDALCDATRFARAGLVRDLTNTPDLDVLRSGTLLVRQIDAGCAK